MPAQDEYDAETHKVLNPIFGKVLLLRPEMVRLPFPRFSLLHTQKAAKANTLTTAPRNR